MSSIQKVRTKNREKGSGEKLTEKPIYKDLEKYGDWRKKLSNFYRAPFTLDGKRWNGVEYYFHANKFLPKYPEFAHQFAISDKNYP